MECGAGARRREHDVTETTPRIVTFESNTRWAETAEDALYRIETALARNGNAGSMT